jgi:hypothetical protein
MPVRWTASVAWALVATGCALVAGVDDITYSLNNADASSTGAADAGDEVTEAGPPTGITYVQGSASGIHNGDTVAVGLPNPVQAHHALIVCVASNGGSPAFTDSLGNTYTAVLGPTGIPTLQGTIAIAEDVPAGPVKVTVKLSASGSYLDVYVHEYAGLARMQAFDVAAANSGLLVDGGAITSGIARTTADNELVFGFGIGENVLAGAGFTARTSYDTNLTEDKKVIQAGPYEATASTSASNNNYVMLMATFKGP